MWGGSDRLFQSLTKSNQEIRSKVEILVDGNVAATFEPVTTVDPVTGKKAVTVDGEVRVSRSQVRREADLSFVDLSATLGDLTATEATDLFAPNRSEVRIWRGYEYWDASAYEKATDTATEYWPVMTGPINRASFQWPNVKIHAMDRLWYMRGRFQQVYIVPAGSNNMDELERLIVKIVPGSVLDYDLPQASATTVALVWEQQDEQLTRANDLAIAEGRVLFCDPMGTIRAVSEPEIIPENVVWTFEPGNANIGDVPSRDIDATDAPNVVVASGESDGTIVPVQGVAKDLNPASFTYIGKTPEVAYFYSSPLLTTTAQAQLAAQTILRRELGLADTIVVPTVPLPGLESGDVVYVSEPKIKVDYLAIADEFNIPLRASGGLMSIDLRAQALVT